MSLFTPLQITAGGNIITGDVLEMRAKQKTFSVTLSRDMIPEAHIIVWQIHNDEVVSDSMNFFINGTWINNVNTIFTLVWFPRRLGCFIQQ